ncbi:MAG: hypothetical protein IBJ07_09505 [Rhizobiaceae bacterium]|nr:hypothetical protein [Rhizobiaceae bacterium]
MGSALLGEKKQVSALWSLSAALFFRGRAGWTLRAIMVVWSVDPVILFQLRAGSCPNVKTVPHFETLGKKKFPARVKQYRRTKKKRRGGRRFRVHLQPSCEAIRLPEG